MSIVGHSTVKVKMLPFTFAVLTVVAAATNAIPQRPVNVIFETDMWPDIDDSMALAMLHALQDRGEANLGATVTNVEDKWIVPIVPYVDLVNTFYGHADIPIGITRDYTSADLRKMQFDRQGLTRPLPNWTEHLAKRQGWWPAQMLAPETDRLVCRNQKSQRTNDREYAD